MLVDGINFPKVKGLWNVSSLISSRKESGQGVIPRVSRDTNAWGKGESEHLL